MKDVPSSLIDYQLSNRNFIAIDLWNLVLPNGGPVYYYASSQQNVTIPLLAGDTRTYVANELLLKAAKFSQKLGLDADEQQVMLGYAPASAANATLIGNVPVVTAIQQGILDGAYLARSRAIFSQWSTTPIGYGDSCPSGALYSGHGIIFRGRIAAISKIGRTSASVALKSDLVLLDVQMPRNYWQAPCRWTLFDIAEFAMYGTRSGCTLDPTPYTFSGTVGAGATQTIIPWSGASPQFALGRAVFTSGANEGVIAGIDAGYTGESIVLNYPLFTIPSGGDTFTAYYGCDKTKATCTNVFNNVGNFGGFPYVPTPEAAV